MDFRFWNPDFYYGIPNITVETISSYLIRRKKNGDKHFYFKFAKICIPHKKAITQKFKETDIHKKYQTFSYNIPIYLKILVF